MWYTFALDKPDKKVSIPQDEWVSCLRSLSSLRSNKASLYAVSFFNGDVKIYDGKDTSGKEILSATNLHNDQIQDMLFIKSESLSDRRFVVTASAQPAPAMKVSEYTADTNDFKVVSQTSGDYSEALGGWNSLSVNPVDMDMFAASSINCLKKPDVVEGEVEQGSV